MKACLAAAAFALVLAIPATGKAGDNPWTAIKQIFHEPVSELKKQFKQLRSPTGAPTAPKHQAGVANADEPPAPVPIPVARPASATIANGTTERAAVQAPATPLQGNSPILVDTIGAGTSPAQSDVAANGSTEAAAAASGARGSDNGAVGAGPVPAQGEIMPLPTTSDDPDESETAGTPIPRPRPDNTFAYAAVGPVPAAKSAAAIGAALGPLPSIARPPPAARSTCGVALARLGVEAKPIAPISDGVCGVPEPVAVAALGGGDIDLTTKAIVDCELAETFANWLDDDVQPVARKLLGGEVIGLRVAASYACRSRNNVAGAKLSEHAHGNAIDISAFNVAGHGWIEVGGLHGLAETRFLRTVRKSACGPFKTVLGPGSDSYHSSHFHLDLAQRNNRGPSKGLYCQ